MAIFYVDEYMLYNTLSDVIEAEYEVYLDPGFNNLIASGKVSKPDNVLEWFNSLPKNIPHKFIEEDTDIYPRVKLHTINSVSPWYLLKPDKSRNIRYYDRDKFVRERIYDKRGNLLKDLLFKEDDKPIDIWFYNTIWKEDFLLPMLDPNEWKTEYFTLGNKIIGNRNLRVEEDGIEGWLKLGTDYENEFMYGNQIEYTSPIPIPKDGYIETKVYLDTMVNSSLTVNIQVGSYTLRLASFISLNGVTRLYMQVLNKNILQQQVVVNSEDDKTYILGIAIEGRVIKFYQNHKELGRYIAFDDLEDTGKLIIKTDPLTLDNRGSYSIDYISVMKKSDFTVDRY